MAPPASSAGRPEGRRAPDAERRLSSESSRSSASRRSRRPGTRPRSRDRTDRARPGAARGRPRRHRAAAAPAAAGLRAIAGLSLAPSRSSRWDRPRLDVAALTAPPRRAPRILFVHDNHPAQFGAFGRWLADRGWDVAFATRRARPRTAGLRVLISYAPHRAPSSAHPPLRPADGPRRAPRPGLRARRPGSTARRLSPRTSSSRTPAGAQACSPRTSSRAPLFVAYCEWWYRHPGPDVAYLAALAERESLSPSIEAPMHERARNAPIAMDLAVGRRRDLPDRVPGGAIPVGLPAGAHGPARRRRHRLLQPGHTRRRPDARGPRAGRRACGHLCHPRHGAAPRLPAVHGGSAVDPHRPRLAVAIVAGENRVAYGGDAPVGSTGRHAQSR